MVVIVVVVVVVQHCSCSCSHKYLIHIVVSYARYTYVVHYRLYICTCESFIMNVVAVARHS